MLHQLTHNYQLNIMNGLASMLMLKCYNGLKMGNLFENVMVQFEKEIIEISYSSVKSFLKYVLPILYA